MDSPQPTPESSTDPLSKIIDTIKSMTPEEREAARKALEKASAKWSPWAKAVLTIVLSMFATTATTEGIRWAVSPGAEPLPAVEPIKLPAEFKGDAHQAITLTAETTGKRVRWRAVDPGLLLIDNLPDLNANKQALCVACTPGRYRVECWSAIDNEPTLIYQTTVVVGNAPPPVPPDPPKPNPPDPPKPPKPNPPDPPKPPKPPPPAPIDPLLAKFQAAYDLNHGEPAKKKAQLGLMIALYGQMVAHTKDASIVTTGDLLADYREAAGVLLIPDTLVDLRKLVAAEVADAFGAESVTLDAAMRERGIALWQRLAKTLAGIRT